MTEQMKYFIKDSDNPTAQTEEMLSRVGFSKSLSVDDSDLLLVHRSTDSLSVEQIAEWQAENPGIYIEYSSAGADWRIIGAESSRRVFCGIRELWRRISLVNIKTIKSTDEFWFELNKEHGSAGLGFELAAALAILCQAYLVTHSDEEPCRKWLDEIGWSGVVNQANAAQRKILEKVAEKKANLENPEWWAQTFSGYETPSGILKTVLGEGGPGGKLVDYIWEGNTVKADNISPLIVADAYGELVAILKKRW